MIGSGTISTLRAERSESAFTTPGKYSQTPPVIITGSFSRSISSTRSATEYMQPRAISPAVAPLRSSSITSTSANTEQ